MPRAREQKPMGAVQIDHIAAVTGAAVLVGFAGRQIWIPKSIIFEGQEIAERDPNPREINVEHWFLKKEGMR